MLIGKGHWRTQWIIKRALLSSIYQSCNTRLDCYFIVSISTFWTIWPPVKVNWNQIREPWQPTEVPNIIGSEICTSVLNLYSPRKKTFEKRNLWVKWLLNFCNHIFWPVTSLCNSLGLLWQRQVVSHVCAWFCNCSGFCGQKGEDPTKGANQHQQIPMFTENCDRTHLSVFHADLDSTHHSDWSSSY